MTEAETNPPEHYMGFQVTDELKPCPFCGCVAVVVPVAMPKSIRFRAICNGCELQTATYGSEDELTTAWNTRASDETERTAIQSAGPLIERDEKLFDDLLGNMAAYAEWGSPSYREGALRKIAEYRATALSKLTTSA